jgi:hypothetical protein
LTNSSNGCLQKKIDDTELNFQQNRRLKLGVTHPHTIESWNNLVDLYEAWNKPEEAKKWRGESVQIEDYEE